VNASFRIATPTDSDAVIVHLQDTSTVEINTSPLPSPLCIPQSPGDSNTIETFGHFNTNSNKSEEPDERDVMEVVHTQLRAAHGVISKLQRKISDLTAKLLHLEDSESIMLARINEFEKSERCWRAKLLLYENPERASRLCNDQMAKAMAVHRKENDAWSEKCKDLAAQIEDSRRSNTALHAQIAEHEGRAAALLVEREVRDSSAPHDHRLMRSAYPRAFASATVS
jgi:hypothetical protein